MIWLLFLLSGLSGTWDYVGCRFHKKDAVETCKYWVLQFKSEGLEVKSELREELGENLNVEKLKSFDIGKLVHIVCYNSVGIEATRSAVKSTSLIARVDEKKMKKILADLGKKQKDEYEYAVLRDSLIYCKEENEYGDRICTFYRFRLNGDSLFLFDRDSECDGLTFWRSVVHDALDEAYENYANHSPKDVNIFVRRRGLRKLFPRKIKIK